MNKKPVSFFNAFLSVVAAAFGVQKSKNLERDREASNPIIFVIAGVLFVFIFVVVVALIANLAV